MKLTISLTLLVLSTIVYGQNQCSCENDSIYSGDYYDCDTTFLKNNSFLFYQLNCDSTWLTLQTANNKMILFSMGADLSDYVFRLGYNLVKEFDKSILFRVACAANGPCNHVLINKTTGEKIKDYGTLIYSADDTLADFIVYFTDYNCTSLALEYVETGKVYKIGIENPEHFNNGPPIPEYLFEESILKDNILTLKYSYSVELDNKERQKTIHIDLKKYTP